MNLKKLWQLKYFNLGKEKTISHIDELVYSCTDDNYTIINSNKHIVVKAAQYDDNLTDRKGYINLMIRISDLLPMQLTEKNSYLRLGHGHYGSISTDHIN
jgi:hypothetical protein